MDEAEGEKENRRQIKYKREEKTNVQDSGDWDSGF